MGNIDKLITDNLDIWTGAIEKRGSQGRGSSKKIELYGIKKLRELILDLGVRGLLVPQDPNDEPASVLLEKIAAEKEQLIKDKKIRKQKPLPEISEDEKPFKLPDGWEWVRLAATGNIFNGNSVNARIKEEKYSVKVGLPFIATKDVGYGFKPLEYKNGTYIPVGEPRFKVASAGAVLICSEGGSAGKKCGITYRDICFGNKLYANEVFDGITPELLLSIYLTPFFYDAFSQSMTGIIGGISTSKFMELIVPIPPETEQPRIVAKVDKLMTLCDQLEQQTESSLLAHQTLVETLLNTLLNADQNSFDQAWERIAQHFDVLFTTEHSIDQLKQTILQLAVMGKLVPQDPNDEPASVLLERIAVEKERLVKEGKIKKQKPLPAVGEDEKPFGLPEGWEWFRIHELLYGDTQNGISMKANEVKGGTPLLRISAATTRSDFIINESEFKLTTAITEAQLKQYSLMKDDLLSVRFNGNKLFVGRTAVYLGYLTSHYVYPDKLIRLRLFKKLSNSKLLSYFINSISIRKVIEAHCATTVGNWGISAKNFKTIPVPIPPPLEQHRIVAKVDELVALCDQLQAQLVEAQTTQLHLTDELAKAD